MRLLPDDRIVDVADDETLLDASVRAGIAHAHACGGVARCSTCRVEVSAGLAACSARTPAEARLARDLHFPDAIRLACQTTAWGPIVVRRLVLDEDDVAAVNQLDEAHHASAVGKLENVAILFADIASFTPFAAALPAYDVVHALNRYFTEMGRIIASQGGRIDNYMGDGLLAVFEREAGADAALRAVRAGRGMLEAVDRLGPYMLRAYGRRFDIRVGIHVGDVISGAIGARGARRATVVGDPVNVASRIENAGKLVGARFLVSDEVRAEVTGAITVSRSFDVPLAGKPGTFLLHEVADVAPADPPQGA